MAPMFLTLLGGGRSLVPLPHGSTPSNSCREPGPGLPGYKLKSFVHVGYPGLSSPRKDEYFFYNCFLSTPKRGRHRRAGGLNKSE